MNYSRDLFGNISQTGFGHVGSISTFEPLVPKVGEPFIPAGTNAVRDGFGNLKGFVNEFPLPGGASQTFTPINCGISGLPKPLNNINIFPFK